MSSIAITAFYKFVAMDERRLRAVRDSLESFADSRGVRGLVVLGGEGVNATVAGLPEVITAFKEHLAEIFPGEIVSFKDSSAEKMPFARFKVDLRSEIITTKDLSISSEESRGTHLTPSEWHRLIESDPDVVIVDTRNDYETEIGVFKGALDPKIKKFSEFQSYLEQGHLPRDKKLLLYCTGGIRCEKAVPEVKRLGYENVYQLEGGILRYLEEYPEGFFEGECFVFDHRVSVDARLQPTTIYKLCPHCGNPAKERLSCKNCGKDTIVCHACVSHEDKNACSKNCAYHIRRTAASRKAA